MCASDCLQYMAYNAYSMNDVLFNDIMCIKYAFNNVNARFEGKRRKKHCISINIRFLYLCMRKKKKFQVKRIQE